MDLIKWAKENSQFLKLDDGESMNLKFVEVVTSLNQEGKPMLAFKFQTMEGDKKILQSKSMVLCRAFTDNGPFKKGDNIILTRHGMKTNTTYEVKPGDIVM